MRANGIEKKKECHFVCINVCVCLGMCLEGFGRMMEGRNEDDSIDVFGTK